MLLVDDDSIALELVSLLLAVNGDTVIPAFGGQEALDVLAQPSLPDVVLVDHQMPHTGGADVVRYVNSLPQPRPRVIAMSASPLPADELALFDSFLLKPVTAEDLAAALHGTRQTDKAQASEPTDRPPSLDAAIIEKLQAT